MAGRGKHQRNCQKKSSASVSRLHFRALKLVPPDPGEFTDTDVTDRPEGQEERMSFYVVCFLFN